MSAPLQDLVVVFTNTSPDPVTVCHAASSSGVVTTIHYRLKFSPVARALLTTLGVKSLSTQNSFEMLQLQHAPGWPNVTASCIALKLLCHAGVMTTQSRWGWLKDPPKQQKEHNSASKKRTPSKGTVEAALPGRNGAKKAKVIAGKGTQGDNHTPEGASLRYVLPS